MKSKLICVALSVSLALAFISLAIAVPIYFRPFYYMQIDGLGIPDETGLTTEEVREAYDSLLDYLTMPWADFSVGKLPYSDEGAAHFLDCRILFGINLGVLIISLISVAVISILIRKGIMRGEDVGNIPKRALKYSGISVIALVLLASVFALFDFDGVFRRMHARLFPYTDNWVFNPDTDPIILALPEKFFARCGIVIGAVSLAEAICSVILSKIISKNKKRATRKV